MSTATDYGFRIGAMEVRREVETSSGYAEVRVMTPYHDLTLQSSPKGRNLVAFLEEKHRALVAVLPDGSEVAISYYPPYRGRPEGQWIVRLGNPEGEHVGHLVHTPKAVP